MHTDDDVDSIQAPPHLRRRVNRTLAQYDRFEEMAQTLDRWADRWSTDILKWWLNLDHLPLIEREKAMVGLALQGTSKAGAALDAYDPGSDDNHESDDAHGLFYQVARIHWEQRHQQSRRRPAA